jgi:hypothetical protein
MIHHGTPPMCCLLMIIFLGYPFLIWLEGYIELGHPGYVRLEPRWYGCNLLDMLVHHVCEPLINSILSSEDIIVC